jgi:hypothetical protein
MARRRRRGQLISKDLTFSKNCFDSTDSGLRSNDSTAERPQTRRITRMVSFESALANKKSTGFPACLDFCCTRRVSTVYHQQKKRVRTCNTSMVGLLILAAYASRCLRSTLALKKSVTPFAQYRRSTDPRLDVGYRSDDDSCSAARWHCLIVSQPFNQAMHRR